MIRVLASAGKDLKGSVFLEALAEREEANRSGKMTVSVCYCVFVSQIMYCYISNSYNDITDSRDAIH